MDALALVFCYIIIANIYIKEYNMNTYEDIHSLFFNLIRE